MDCPHIARYNTTGVHAIECPTPGRKCAECLDDKRGPVKTAMKHPAGAMKLRAEHGTKEAVEEARAIYIRLKRITDAFYSDRINPLLQEHEKMEEMCNRALELVRQKKKEWKEAYDKEHKS